MIRRNYKLPPTFKLGSQGSGCFLEPPNHPTYFTRSVYTRFGNTPNNGPQYEFNGIFFDNLEEANKFFKPLPYDSERVKAWEAYAYHYFNHCYSPNGTNRNVNDCIIDKENKLPPERHLAFLLIKKHYPEATPNKELIANPVANGGNWWERLAVKPKPEECPGEEGIGKHPVNGSWCQVCGWKQEQK